MRARFTVTLPIPLEVRSWIREIDGLVNQARTTNGDPAARLVLPLSQAVLERLMNEAQGTGLVFEETPEGLRISDAHAAASLDYLVELLQATQRRFGLSDTWSFTYASTLERDGGPISTGGTIVIKGERAFRHDALTLQQAARCAFELPPAPERLDEPRVLTASDLSDAEDIARALLQPFFDIATPDILRAAQNLLEVRPGAATSFVAVHPGELLEGADAAAGAASLTTAQEAILEARRALLSAGRSNRPVTALEAALAVAIRSARAELENRMEAPEDDLLSP